MRFFTEEWYAKFYGQGPDALSDAALYEELVEFGRAARAWWSKKYAQFPNGSKLGRYSFHDAVVKRMEARGRNLVMHLDSKLCWHSVNKLVFTNVTLVNVPVDFAKKVDLDWFQDEIVFRNGKYRIGILFRDWGQMPPGAERGFAFPAPYIMEFEAENASFEEGVQS